MAQSGINLIPELTEKEIHNVSNRKRANSSAIITLIIVGTIVALLILYRLFLTYRASDIASRTEKAETKIARFHDVEITQLTLADKLSQAKQILQNALPGSVALDQVNQAALKANTVVIKEISLSSDGLLEVDGIAPNSDIFASWVTNLTTGETAKSINRVNLTSLVKVDTGYSFSMDMSFNQRGVVGQ